MRWDFGSIYKQIRESKGLTQKEVCGDVLSRTTLAKIESNQVMPKFENMVFLLEQINMSLEEFKYICNIYQPSERQNIFNRVYNHLSISGIDELYDIQHSCREYLKIHHDITIEYILDVITVFINVREHGFLEPTEELQAVTQKIWRYLEKQDTWYERDLKMLNAILFHFSLEQLPALTDKILESLKKYSDYTQIADAQHSLLSNLATIYLYNGQLERCETITLITYELAQKTKRFDRLGFSQVRLGICRDDKKLIEKELALLELTEEKELFHAMKEELTILKK